MATRNFRSYAALTLTTTCFACQLGALILALMGGTQPTFGLLPEFSAGQWSLEGGSTQPQNGIILGENPKVIEIPGVEIDIIQKVIEARRIFPSAQNSSHTVDARNLLDWESSCLAISKEIFDCSDMPDEHWRTLCGNSLSLSSMVTCSPDVRSHYIDFKQKLQAIIRGQTFDLSTCFEYALMVCSLYQNRCFFPTKNGCLGLGPLNSKPGDRICIS